MKVWPKLNEYFDPNHIFLRIRLQMHYLVSTAWAFPVICGFDRNQCSVGTSPNIKALTLLTYFLAGR